jgi:hypothetical protein
VDTADRQSLREIIVALTAAAIINGAAPAACERLKAQALEILERES